MVMELYDLYGLGLDYILFVCICMDWPIIIENPLLFVASVFRSPPIIRAGQAGVATRGLHVCSPALHSVIVGVAVIIARLFQQTSSQVVIGTYR